MRTYLYKDLPYEGKPAGQVYQKGRAQHFNSDEIVSFGHAWPPPPGYTGDMGNIFLLKRERASFNTLNFEYWYSQGNLQFRGPTWLENPLDISGYSVIEPLAAVLNAAGTTAISRVLPNAPTAGLAVFLGEAREGFPRIFGSGILESRARDLRKTGDEYLNYQFGWVPLVSDLRTFAHNVINSHKVVQQYRASRNTKIRRRFHFPSSTVSIAGNTRITTKLQSFASPNSANVQGQIHATKTTERWFSGAFRFPPVIGDDLGSKFKRFEQEANKLLGTRLTPEVVWNLAPWSWAADWFGNTGDIMRNISYLGADGLVMQYGYIMERQTALTHMSGKSSWVGFNGLGQITNPLGAPMYRINRSELKLRRAATPYGFGVDVASLSTKQWAILAALGISRGPNQLKID